jgi:hypothetical protein
MKSHLESTCTGKIARLPRAIRRQLNEWFADGEPNQEEVGEGEKAVPLATAETGNPGQRVQSSRA